MWPLLLKHCSLVGLGSALADFGTMRIKITSLR